MKSPKTQGGIDRPALLRDLSEDKIMTRERDLAIYRYTMYAFRQLAEENETIKENLARLKTDIQKQLNIEVMNVAYDAK